jgi:adenosylcobyric acid synthase
VRRSGRVLGICGGYQMLGRRIADQQGVEGPSGAAGGLGLLDVETVLTGDKVLRRVEGHLANGEAFAGYEIHAGRTDGAGTAQPMLTMAGHGPDGAVSADGRIMGCYIHGLFDQASARASLLGDLGVTSSRDDRSHAIDQALDEIAQTLETSLDIAALSKLAGLTL